MSETITARFEWVALAAANVVPQVSEGAEGASGHYLAALADKRAFALPPQCGLRLADISRFQGGEFDAAIPVGRVDVALDTDVTRDSLAVIHSIAAPALGASDTTGASGPFGRTALTPVHLNRTRGRWNSEVSQSFIVSTGECDVDERVALRSHNVGFDPDAAITCINSARAIAVSPTAGFMAKTENADANRRTGKEFHIASPPAFPSRRPYSLGSGAASTTRSLETAATVPRSAISNRSSRGSSPASSGRRQAPPVGRSGHVLHQGRDPARVRLR